MEINQFVCHFENAIEGIEPGSLTPETQYHKLAQWDSLGLLCLLAMIDCEYDVQISGMELKSCDTLRAIFDLAAGKKHAVAA
jgi:acyl carrier protein